MSHEAPKSVDGKQKSAPGPSAGSSPPISGVELLLSAILVALIASVAIPKYLEHRGKRRTVQVTANLARIASGAQTYFLSSGSGAGKSTAALLLPRSSRAWYPKMSHATACKDHDGVFPAAVNQQFDTTPWRELDFMPKQPLTHRYHWVVQRQTSDQRRAVAHIFALGDLDCDGTYSKWRLTLTDEHGTLRRSGPTQIAGAAAE